MKYGPNVKHIAIKPQDSENYMRLYKLLGDEYEESGIRVRIEAARQTPAKAPPEFTALPGRPIRRRPRRFRMPREHQRLKGIKATYYKYLYLLGKVGKRKVPQRVSFALRADLAKLDRYKRQFHFLQETRIESTTELGWYADAMKNEIDILVARRKPLYAARRVAWESDIPGITSEIESINAALRPLRQRLRLCGSISQDADVLRQKVESVQAMLDRPPEQARAREKAPR